MLNEEDTRKKLKEAEEMLLRRPLNPQALVCVCTLRVILEETAEPELTLLIKINQGDTIK